MLFVLCNHNDAVCVFISFICLLCILLYVTFRDVCIRLLFNYAACIYFCKFPRDACKFMGRCCRFTVIYEVISIYRSVGS